MNYVPFVYLITFIPTGEYYYGSHYANKNGVVAHPSRLGISYFTHSKVVWGKIKEFGKEAFTYEVRKTFNTAEEAVAYEHRFLKRVNAARNPKFLNENNGDGKFFGGPKSDKARANMSLAWETRAPATTETRNKMSLASKGKPKTDEHAQKIAAALTGKEHTPERIAKITIANRKSGSLKRELRAAALEDFNSNAHIYPPKPKSLRAAALGYFNSNEHIYPPKSLYTAALEDFNSNAHIYPPKPKFLPKIKTTKTKPPQTKRGSPEHRANISASKKGKKMPPRTAEACHNSSIARIGKKHRPDTIVKMSKSAHERERKKALAKATSEKALMSESKSMLSIWV